MRRAAVLLFACLLVAGCGSTVQQAGRTSVSGGGLDGTDAAIEGTTGGELGGEAALETSGATSAAAGRRPATTGSVPAAARAAAAQAAGARGGAVKIGIRYPENSSGLLTTFSFSGVNPGDSKAMAETVVADINSRGGIAGRRIEPVYVPFDVTGSIAPGGSDAEQQKACSAFTEDNKVFAVVSPIIGGEILETCLNKRGVVFVDENWGYFDPAATGPGYWTPSYPDPIRSVHALVDRLWVTGFMPAGSKVGAVWQDLPTRKRVVDGLRAALARHGLKLDDTVAWSGRDTSQLAAGVLKFRSTSITHVFVLDPGGLETFGWMTEAEAQAFRPKYALDTRNYPFLQAGQSPPAQLANARGIGWVPSADVGVQPPGELNPAERRCLDVVNKAGQNMGDATNVRVALAYCNTLELLKVAAGDASTELTLASVQRGGEALGDRYAPIGTFITRFGPGRHDGAAGARDFTFDGGCSCFRYSGPVFSLG